MKQILIVITALLITGQVFTIPHNYGSLIRLGTRYGGWTIPANLLSMNSVVYSAGAGEDISFDIEVAQRFGCKVFIFDPTPRAIKHASEALSAIKNGREFFINKGKYQYVLDPWKLSNITFLPMGLWNSNITLKFYSPRNNQHVSHSILNLQKTNSYFVAPCKTLETIMQDNKHKRIDLLKLDIEGAEYEIIKYIAKNKINITCICLEFDEMAGVNKECNSNIPESIHRIEKSVKLLQNLGYEIIYQKDYTDMTFLYTGQEGKTQYS